MSKSAHAQKRHRDELTKHVLVEPKTDSLNPHCQTGVASLALEPYTATS